MKKLLIILISVSALATLLVVAVIFAPTNAPSNEMSATIEDTSSEDTSSVSTPETTEPVVNDIASTQPGRYETYEVNKVSSEGYEQTILFFYAPWCPECRAFDEAITSSSIPAGVQILQVDYDSATELRQKHEVTLQSTFVEVDANGAQVAKWVGYGKDKSVDTILENL